MITIRNEFHNTQARIRAGIGDVLTPSQVKRCRRKLCGIKGCTCGGELSERGRQRDNQGHRFYLLPVGPDEVEIVDSDPRGWS